MTDFLHVGFVGLGNMGAPMAARLVSAGHRVVGFDPAPAAIARLRDSGGESVESVTGAAAPIVVLMLPNSEVVDAVLFDDGLAANLAAGSLVIDMSSSAPLRTRATAERLAALGVRVVDAPVSGGVSGAESGHLTIMVGGDAADVDDATPVLQELGRTRHVGPVGAGHALKALNNLLSAAHLWATSEAILVGERFGLEAKAMLEAINESSGRSGSTQTKWPKFVLPETFDSGFGLALMLKDIRTATALAHELGMPITLGDATTERWAAAAADMPSDADHTEIVTWMRRHVPGEVRV